ncbi:hypothetical protein SLS55_008980 [Diplodia seriata]|uniref:Uncharacterized protein n=1 Tax=Diplodia seriata TaxID=420778 RepID=A0ABR3C7H8_9PEZI
MSFYFNAVNRNKRSITLDLKKPEGRQVLLELAKTSDVLIENFVPGKADELGIGYDVVSGINQAIIYASISGYGPSGPYERRAGYDAIAAAEAGLMHITGGPGQPPARAQTGKGQKLDASLFETQISLLINIGANWLNMGLEGKRFGNAHPSLAPYDTFQTKDGYLAVGANNDRQFKILVERLGKPELLDDSRFKTNAARVQHRKALDTVVADVIKEKTLDEWMKALEGSGLAHGPVNTIERAFAHPQIQARNMVESIPVEEVASGSVKMIGVPVKFSSNPGQIRTRAPYLGEHTDEVLKEIGYSEGDIDALREKAVV